MITLKEHNKRPYEGLCKMLEKHNKCAYVSATGTGKSYVIGKYIEEHGLIDKTLMLVPTRAIKNSWEKLLPGLHIVTYQWLSKSDYKLGDVELIVCDEMHHLGAKAWGAAYEKLTENYDGKFIGMSATPIRYLDNCRDIASDFYDGNVVEGVSLPEAIEQGILPSFEYTAALYDMPKRAKKYRESGKMTQRLMGKLDYVESRYSFENILIQTLQGTDTKTAVFVSSISELDSICELVKGLFPDAAHYIVNSDMYREDVKRSIAEFTNKTGMSFIYAVDLLNEGIHIDGVNAVVMFRKTSSPVVYLQQLGRALTSDQAGGRVKIIDFVANHANLKSYTQNKHCTINWITSGISSGSRQIIVNDYAFEELELLEKMSALYSGLWSKEEDEMLSKYYADGRDVVQKFLPHRTLASIQYRAVALGIAKSHNIYSDDFYEDLKKYYPKPGGMKFMYEKYPFLTRVTLIAVASRCGIHCKRSDYKWSVEEVKVLQQNAALSTKKLMKLLPGKTALSIAAKKISIGCTKKRERWSDAHEKILMQYPNNHPQWFINTYHWRFDRRTVEQHRIALGLEPKIERKVKNA